MSQLFLEPDFPPFSNFVSEHKKHEQIMEYFGFNYELFITIYFIVNADRNKLVLKRRKFIF